MGMKRKRPAKVVIPSDEEQTFINNSDLDSDHEVSFKSFTNDATGISSFNGDNDDENPFVSDVEIDKDDVIDKEAKTNSIDSDKVSGDNAESSDETTQVNGANNGEEIKANGEEITANGEDLEHINPGIENTHESLNNGTTIINNGDISEIKIEINDDNDSNVFDDHSKEPKKSCDDLSPKLELRPPPQLVHPPGHLLQPPSTAESFNKSSLSYSQQQSEIVLQSPSKRREIPVNVPKKNEPRLIINKLVLTNFKSYAGEQVIGPFNASFSAVVGPNGSGKSNVIDSMLFVFGFRALKMRQGKLSELIHNSSGGEKLDYCQVDIHFQHVLDDPNDERKADVIPESDIVISRKALKNNQSTYYINGKGSNYTEVTLYLKDKGIDLDHKRFLILQGEVESIAQMKAKAERENDDGLLEYLEDIIGTSQYKQLIEENLAKIEELNDICLEKENRFELVEKDKNLLEDKKTEALHFLETEKKLTNKKSTQYQISIAEKKAILKENEVIVAGLEEELAKEKEANSELNESIDTLIKQQKDVKASMSKINDNYSRVNKKQKEITRFTVSMEEKSKNLANKLKKIAKTKELLEHTLSSSTQKLQNSNDAVLQFKSEIEELNANLEVEKGKLDEIRTNLTAKTSQFTNQIETLQTKLEPWNDKLKEKDNAILLAKSSLEMLQSQKENAAKQLETARQRLINIKKEGKLKETEFIESENKLVQIEEQISLGEEQCNLEKQQLDKQKALVSSQRQKSQDATSSLTSYQNKNKVLSSLLRLAKSGRIEGFYGRLGDLGVIDDIYDIAISTACPGLDSMVVETVETAQACIDYLRKNKLGYANFICLNKLRQFNLTPVQTPGNPANIKRLFDLIRPQNPKFAPAFYSKVYNTLVAPDLKEAKQVAYGAKRWKVVTLDGKVVDTSGTMSGGGNSFAKGGMRLSNSTNEDAMDITPEDVDQMKEDLRRMESKYEMVESEYKQKLEVLNKLKDLKPETEFTISRLKLDIQSLSSERKEVTAVCKNLIAESENTNTNEQFEEQIQEKQSELETLIEERKDLKSQMVDLEAQIKELEAKIMDAGGVELKVQNSKVDSIKQKIEIINEKTSGDRMAIRKLENDIKRHTKIVAESSHELEATKSDLETIQVQHKERREELEKVNLELSQLEEAKNEKENEIETLRCELEDKEQQINKFKSFEIELGQKIEKYSSIIKRAKRHIEEDQELLERLVVRDTKPYIDWMDEEDQLRYDGAVLEKLDETMIDDIDLDAINIEIAELESYMDNVKVDIEVLKEYGSKKLDFETRRADLNEAVQGRDEIKNYCEELKRKRLDEFMEGFNTISMTLKDMYRMITMGGNAELELVDSLDPFSEGILFSVMPPKKSWKNISNLSGGEKTLSSLALVFALHQYKPTPLYVMDEIDAALDFRNVSIVANYIKERTKNAQFVVISLRNNMFELAQQLVGIYKVDNKTKSISLKNKEFF